MAKRDWYTPQIEKLGQIALQAYLDNTGRCTSEQWAVVASSVIQAYKRRHPKAKVKK